MNRVVALKTMHMSPKDVLVATEVNFVGGLTTDQLEKAIDEVETIIPSIAPSVTSCFVEPRDLGALEARPKKQLRVGD